MADPDLTASVQFFLAEPDDATPPDAFPAQRYLRAEARKITRDAPDIATATDDLKSWFLDRLTVDPGHPGPFGALATDLIAAALERVDWRDIAYSIREVHGPTDPDAD